MTGIINTAISSRDETTATTYEPLALKPKLFTPKSCGSSPHEVATGPGGAAASAHSERFQVGLPQRENYEGFDVDK